MVQLPLPAYLLIAFASPFLIGLYLKTTKGGLRLFAVGNAPDKSRRLGVDPGPIRFWAQVATGILCGLAGALIVSNTGGFTDGMTAGRGYIALAALILGGWRPIPVLLACLLFGGFEATQLQLQGTKLFGALLPSEFWSAVPYVVTIVALAGFLGRSKPPAGLGKP
jgi:simple sugar transport system permease protein